MMQITTTALMGILSNIKGGTMVYLSTLTTLDVPSIGRVQKYCKQSIQVGCSYENSVNNKLAKEGFKKTFKSGRLPWGRWFILNRIITHNGYYYARFYKTNNACEKITYIVNGREATPQEVVVIKVYDTEIPSAKQSRYGLTDIKKQSRVRNYRLDTILSISADGETYKVSNEVATAKS
jgi:hypothetical protein